jgi:hypothetical protein
MAMTKIEEIQVRPAPEVWNSAANWPLRAPGNAFVIWARVTARYAAAKVAVADPAPAMVLLIAENSLVLWCGREAGPTDGIQRDT